MANINIIQNNFQNMQMNLKHMNRGANDAHDRLPTRGGGTHARYNSDVSSGLAKEGRQDQTHGATASSNKDSNQALSGASRVSGVSYASDAKNQRMLGSVDISAGANLAEVQVPNPGDYTRSSKRKNR